MSERPVFYFTIAGVWDCVAAVERLPALHYSVDFIFLSFGFMGFIVEFEQKLASLAQEICTLYFQVFGAAFASTGYPFKNIFACSYCCRFSLSTNLDERKHLAEEKRLTALLYRMTWHLGVTKHVQ